MIRFRLGTSVFQFRRNNAVIGVLGASVLLIILYFLVATMQPKFPNVNSVLLRNDIEKKDLFLLENRLENLEQELQINRVVMYQVKDVVKSLMKVEPEEFNVFNIKFDIKDRVFVKGSPGDFCLNLASAHSDENTLDIYRKIDFENKDGGVWKQGWNIQYDVNSWNANNKLKVFVVPHSHNDPGWIKTFEKYYDDQTQHILNNMVSKMKDDAKRKFIWAEVSFFALWWSKTDKISKDIVRRLVNDGQLEIVTGGWVMNDEATAHYYAMIEQMAEGHQWLKENLDYKPKNGWAIDPFGLSPTMAFLLRRMGIDNMVIQRVHYSIKKYLAQRKSLEFLWRQQWDTSNAMDILCHTMPFYSYDIPHTCGPDPKVCCQFDFKRLPGNKVNCPWRVPPVAITEKNVAARAAMLLDQYRKKSKLFRSNVVMIQLGDDFRYDKATEWDQQFNNYQKMFDYINNKEEWHAEAHFGTLEDYFNALREDKQVNEQNLSATFPSLIGDFFTYADRDDHYWSGFFTSRPFYKNLDRVLEAYLRGAEILFTMVLSNLNQETIISKSVLMETSVNGLVSSRRALSLFQHHDAITGTSKDHVVLDYALKMFFAITELQKLIGHSAMLLLAKNIDDIPDEESVLLQSDEIIHHNYLSTKKVMSFLPDRLMRHIVLYNSLGYSRTEYVRIRVQYPSVVVRDSLSNIVPCQVNPVFDRDKLLHTEFELVFLAEMPPVSLVTYSIHKIKEVMPSHQSFVKLVQHENFRPNIDLSSVFPMEIIDKPKNFSIKSKFTTATFSGTNGMLQKIEHLELGSEIDVEIKFFKYGTRTKGKDKSGAYLFLPDGDAKEVDYNEPYIRILEGPLLSEVVVIFHDVEHHVVLKNSPGSDGIGFDIYNIINISNEFNKELIMRFVTNISSHQQEFFTDLNGFQMIRRQYFAKLPIQANVYPVTTMAFMEDQSTRFTILTAQSVGATSLQPGVFDVFLDRRLNQDDNRGLQQGVTDNIDTLSRFRVMFEQRSNAYSVKLGSVYPSLLAHHCSLSLLHPIIILFRPHSDTDLSFDVVNDFPLKPSFSLANEMPCDIHLLNLKTLSSSSGTNFIPIGASALYLQRFGFDCSFPMYGNCSYHNGTVSVDRIFPNLFGKNVEEASLSLLYTGKTFPREAYIQIPPMDIVTLKLSQR